MKISEFKNEKAVELLADIIDPMSKIFSDQELALAVKRKANRMECVKIALKNHSKEVVEIVARMDGVDPETYECGMVKILSKALEIINDKELSDFFTSQEQIMEQRYSTPAMANTEAEEQ